MSASQVDWTKEGLEARVQELGRIQAWNHNIELPNGVETNPGVQVSHGKNLVKWERVEPLLRVIGVAGKRVLDIGCNEGFFSVELARLGAEVVGIDVDEHRIDKARFVRSALAERRVRFEQMSVYAREFTDQSPFDLCLCMGFLHRIPDPFGAMAQLAELSDIILFEWKALKFGSHDEPFAYYTPGGFDQSDFYGTQFWVLSFACVEAMLRRLGFDRFHRIDDPSFRRAILVTGKVDNPVFELPDLSVHRGRTRSILSHTKRYLRTVGKVLSGRLNA